MTGKGGQTTEHPGMMGSKEGVDEACPRLL